MTELIFWLIITFSSGTVVMPVPYQNEAQCSEAGEASGRGYKCIQQPKGDVKEWIGRGLYGESF